MLLLVCAVILHLALCWKHGVTNLFLRQTFKTKTSTKIHKLKNVRFDTKNEFRIIVRDYLV